MNEIAFLIPGGVALLAFAGWTGRIWIKRLVEKSVDSKFEVTLEALRSDLRVKESKIASLQVNALSSRSGRQAIVDKRRIEALESIWDAAVKLGKFKQSAMVLGMLKLDVVSKRVVDEPKLRTVISTMVGYDLNTIKEYVGDSEGLSQRPYLPIDVWGTFSALQSILIFSVMKLATLASGLPDHEKLTNDNRILEIAKETLPHMQSYVDQFGISGIGNLVDPLIERLVMQIQNALDGNDADKELVERSQKVVALVHEMEASKAKEQAAKIS